MDIRGPFAVAGRYRKCYKIEIHTIVYPLSKWEGGIEID
jgi:hypothetical protein